MNKVGTNQHQLTAALILSCIEKRIGTLDYTRDCLEHWNS